MSSGVRIPLSPLKNHRHKGIVMQYPDCIFCGGDTKNATIEHIWPESLGGTEEVCMRNKLVCEKCNNYFGSNIERQALNDYPFLHYRFSSCITTKRGKYPKIKTRIGDFISSPFERIIGLNPRSEEIERRINNGHITQFRILAEITDPYAICRFLLKMGLEIIADDRPYEIYNSKYDAARRVARSPKLGDKWWFLFIRDDMSWLSNELPVSKGIIELSTSIIEGHEMFCLKTNCFSFITPIEQEFIPDPSLRRMDNYYVYEIVF